jgi:hypothetical protein
MAIKKIELYSTLWSSCDALHDGMETEFDTFEQRPNKTKQINQDVMQELPIGKTYLPLDQLND